MFNNFNLVYEFLMLVSYKFSIQERVYHPFEVSQQTKSRINKTSKTLSFFIKQNKTLKIYIFNEENNSFARFARGFFMFIHNSRTRPIHDVKSPVLQLCGQLEHLKTILIFNFLYPFQSKPYQCNHRIVTTYFPS